MKLAEIDKIAFFSEIPILSGLSRRHLRQLELKSVARQYASGSKIVTQGTRGVGMYIIVSGQAKVVLTRQNGSVIDIDTFGPKDFFGELSLLAVGSRTSSVVALETTMCLVLLRSDFLKLMEEDALMATRVAQSLAVRFRRALEEIR